MVDGRPLNVRVRSEPPSGPGARRGPGGPRPEDDLPPECKLYVGCLPQHVEEQALSQEFARFGPVVRWVRQGGRQGALRGSAAPCVCGMQTDRGLARLVEERRHGGGRNTAWQADPRACLAQPLHAPFLGLGMAGT